MAYLSNLLTRPCFQGNGNPFRLYNSLDLQAVGVPGASGDLSLSFGGKDLPFAAASVTNPSGKAVFLIPEIQAADQQNTDPERLTAWIAKITARGLKVDLLSGGAFQLTHSIAADSAGPVTYLLLATTKDPAPGRESVSFQPKNPAGAAETVPSDIS